MFTAKQVREFINASNIPPRFKSGLLIKLKGVALTDTDQITAQNLELIFEGMGDLRRELEKNPSASGSR